MANAPKQLNTENKLGNTSVEDRSVKNSVYYLADLYIFW